LPGEAPLIAPVPGTGLPTETDELSSTAFSDEPPPLQPANPYIARIKMTVVRMIFMLVSRLEKSIY